MTEEEFKKLRKCLASGLIAMTGQEFYLPAEDDLGTLRFTETDEEDGYSNSLTYDFAVYPSMTKTLAYLKTFS